jgi:hypothetical protein
MKAKQKGAERTDCCFFFHVGRTDAYTLLLAAVEWASINVSPRRKLDVEKEISADALSNSTTHCSILRARLPSATFPP